MIALEAVAVRYGPVTALAGVGEQVTAGEWLTIIGPNGAGKSTLLRCIAHLAQHDGKITIAGQPIAGLSRRQLARLVAYVPQAPVLPPEMTVSDYVLLGRTPHIGYLRMETTADRRICGELLDRLGLAAMMGRMLPTLSGGEAQRVRAGPAPAPPGPGPPLGVPNRPPGPGPRGGGPRQGGRRPGGGGDADRGRGVRGRRSALARGVGGGDGRAGGGVRGGWGGAPVAAGNTRSPSRSNTAPCAAAWPCLCRRTRSANRVTSSSEWLT